jgi:hypothetical protein
LAKVTVSSCHFQPRLTFEGAAGAYQSGAL